MVAVSPSHSQSNDSVGYRFLANRPFHHSAITVLNYRRLSGQHAAPPIRICASGVCLSASKEPGRTLDLTNRSQDLQAEVITETGAEAFFPDTGFARLLLEKVEDKLAQQRNVFGAIASADAVLIYVEVHVNDPVTAILNRPMGASSLNQPIGLACAGAELMK